MCIIKHWTVYIYIYMYFVLVTYIWVVGFVRQQVGAAPPPEETHDGAANLGTEGLAQLGTDGQLLHLTQPEHRRYQPIGQKWTNINLSDNKEQQIYMHYSQPTSNSDNFI